MLVEPTEPRERIVLECTRVCDRLRTLNSSRLATIADATHAIAQWILLLDLKLEGRPVRDLPRLGDEVLEAQLRVVVADLLAVAGPNEDAVLAEAADALTDLRKSLP